MASNIQILSLKQQPDCIHALAQWHQCEWRGTGRSVPITRRVQRLRSHLQDEGLPNTWVAMEGEELVGSVSVVDYVFREERDASAWVANLFVVPNRRGAGLGAALLAFAEAAAHKQALQRLFLFTPDRREFYRQRGWQFLHQARVQSQWVDVMTKPLGVARAELDGALVSQQILREGRDFTPSQSSW